MSRPGRRWALAAAVALAAGLAGCGTDVESAVTTTTGSASTSTCTTLLVDPSEAREAVEVFMEANNEANAVLDTSILVGVETGSAAALDEAYYRGQRNLQGEGAEGATFTWDDVEVYLPRTTEYPASFLATLSITDDDTGDEAIQVQVYEKASEAAGWKLSQYVNLVAGSNLPEIDVDPDGYLPEVDPADLLVEPEEVAQELADLLADPDADNSLEPSPAVDDARQIITDRVAEDARETLAHDITYDVPTSPGYPTYTFALRGGGALVLGVTGVRETIAANEGTITVEADVTGGLVPAGEEYTRIELRSLVSFFATVGTDDTGDGAEVVQLYQGFILARAE